MVKLFDPFSYYPFESKSLITACTYRVGVGLHLLKDRVIYINYSEFCTGDQSILFIQPLIISVGLMNIYFTLGYNSTTLFSFLNYSSFGHWELFQLVPVSL